MYFVIEVLFFISLGCTVGSLGFGLYAYFKGGVIQQQYSNAAMRWRVLLQAVTLVLFMLMLWLKS